MAEENWSATIFIFLEDDENGDDTFRNSKWFYFFPQKVKSWCGLWGFLIFFFFFFPFFNGTVIKVKQSDVAWEGIYDIMNSLKSEVKTKKMINPLVTLVTPIRKQTMTK